MSIVTHMRCWRYRLTLVDMRARYDECRRVLKARDVDRARVRNRSTGRRALLSMFDACRYFMSLCLMTTTVCADDALLIR